MLKWLDVMNENELEVIRKKKLEELRMLGEQQIESEEQAAQMEGEKQALLRQILTPAARERLGTVQLAHPELVQVVEHQLILLKQSGRINKVDDNLLRQILRKLSPNRREIKIERR